MAPYNSVMRSAFHALIGAGILFSLAYLIFTNNSQVDHQLRNNIGTDNSTNSFSNIFQFHVFPSHETAKSPQHSASTTPVVIYNRLPKTGSTTVMGIAYELCSSNEGHVIHINITRNSHILSLRNQLRLVQNISHWKQVHPALYHGHFSFIDFSQFGSDISPLYINVVRDPMERLVSYYYFLRYGDDFRPHLIRKRMKNPYLRNQTFDECVQVGGSDCDFKKLWIQVPFFCGQSPVCWIPGNREALEMAKRNLLTKYFLVGTTEKLREFLWVLEKSLPQFFKGAMSVYDDDSLGLSHRRRTREKRPLQQSTIDAMKQSLIWQVEQEFYEYVKVNFIEVMRREQSSQFMSQDVFYEKIKSRHALNATGKHVLTLET